MPDRETLRRSAIYTTLTIETTAREVAMKRTYLCVAVGLLLLLSVGACRSRPIYNVIDAPLSSAPATPLDDVSLAIRRAAIGLGWDVKEQSPGSMGATLELRRHVAVVANTFDTEQVSIQYVSSEHLRATGDTIHRNYNRWIKNLQVRIQREVLALRPT